jgi:hypothetical protein
MPTLPFGIITGLTSLMVIFQLPTAHQVDPVRYKHFMVTGWGTHTSLHLAWRCYHR